MFGMLKEKFHQQNEIENLNLYIFDGKGPNLLGRNWLNVIKLNWNNVIKSSPNKEGPQLSDELGALIDKHSSLFSDKLGKAKLNVKEKRCSKIYEGKTYSLFLKRSGYRRN